MFALAAYGLAAGGANASSLLGVGQAATAVEAIAAPVSHQQQYWHWDGAWWRHGPWAHHGIHGMVIPRPWMTPVFVPWGGHRLQACAARYRSFDPATGTYVTARGERRICR